MWWVLVSIGVYLILREQNKPTQIKLPEPRLVSVSPLPSTPPASAPLPLPTSNISGLILPWNINSLSLGARITFSEGETKTWIARITSPVRGFSFIFYPIGGLPSGDLLITGSFKMPLKPDGQPYKTVTGKTEVSGFWAKADGAITLKVHTVKAPGPLFVLDDFIYPGDFLISLKADGAGWGFLNTELFQ